ncbi:TetR family transcriptional regulator [Dictyobacter alpinus]|uniref:TetR family transcriptional regulator n=1 Tax=Dictyobacter alpinus TaxID=2014873 RepID=A0A402BJP3_9CHLR|nr:TetR/AcrR family transcriptional regulator [Dictyobacter alpinus]GCE31568.1 TetR family transcriptional regulator [Dictyobacter alpinus]
MTQSKEEQVLNAARKIFMRYGFKRATMSDLAEAAQMSRPALYLIFSSKEEVFQALITQIFSELLHDVRKEVSTHEEVADQLTSAFEVWCVRPFEMIQASPDARDILESGYAFATEITMGAFAEFETILSDILRPLMSDQANLSLSPEQLAHILNTATQGFKESASSAMQIRQLIKGLITIVLAGLNH